MIFGEQWERGRSEIKVVEVKSRRAYICRVPLLRSQVMKALADNNLRTAEVSLFNGENGVGGAFQRASGRRVTTAPTAN